MPAPSGPPTGPPTLAQTGATFSTDSSFSLVITETNAAQTVTGKINVIDPDAGQACLDLARTLGYSTASDYYKTGEATNNESYYGSKTIFTLLSNNQLAVISDGDPYPAKAGAINFTNDLISTRFTSFIIEQDFEYKFTYRGGNLNSDASYSNFFSTSAMGIQGIFLNGVALYNPSSGNGTVTGTTISGSNIHNLNAVFFERQYGIDESGGHPSPEGNVVNGFQGQMHYHDPMFLTSGAWNNETFASSNTYFSSDYYTDASGNIDYIRHANGHSKIVGFCFDGYPIYGPYGYDGSFNSTSPSVLMTTSYQTKATEFAGRPYTYDASLSGYTLSAGAFLDDYEYVPGMGSLDDCNGRFCVTPEYPNGTYAYFVLINEADEPVFPYILGKYSRQQRTVMNGGYPIDNHNTGGSVTPTTGIEGVFSVSTLGVSKYVSSPINQTIVDVSYGSFTIDSSGNWSYTMSAAHDEFVTDVSYNDSIRVYSYDGSANRLVTVTMMGTAEAPLGPPPSAIRACLSCSQNSSSLHIVNVTDYTGTVVYKWIKDAAIVGTDFTFDYINTVDCSGSTLVAQVGDNNGYVTIATMTIGSDYKIALVIADTYVNRIPDWNDDGDDITIGQEGTGAFYYGFRNSDLTSVVIGNAVTSIGDHAFYGNQLLVDVIIGESVASITGGMSFGCPGITAITIPDATTSINVYTFSGADAQTHNINTFHIGAGMQNVDFLTTWDNHVTTLTISPNNQYLVLDTPQGVVYKKVDANNASLGFVLYDKTSVAIPATVTIGGAAIPVTSINWNAFANVTSVSISDENTTFVNKDGIFYQKVDANNASIVMALGGVTSAVIPSTIQINGAVIPVTSIQEGLFSDKTSLTAVSIGNNVSYIGASAFNNTRIESIFIPASVTNIEYSAFANDTSLNSVTFAGNSPLTSLRYGTFENTKISVITIPNSVVDIQESVFNGCSLLTNVIIPSSVTSIDINAFNGCSLLTQLSIDSANATYAGQDGILYKKVDDTNATIVVVSGGVTHANIRASVTIGGQQINVTSIADNAKLNKLTTVSIPDTILSIGYNVFNDGPLVSVTIPDSVTAIKSSFINCHSLTEVTIGSAVISLSSAAFCNSEYLANVYFLGNNVTTTNAEGNSYDFFTDNQFLGIASNAVAHYVDGKSGWSAYSSASPPAGFSNIQTFVPESPPSGPTYTEGMNLSSGSLSVPSGGALGNVSGGTVNVSSGTANIDATTGAFAANLQNGSANITTFNGSSAASVDIGAGKILSVEAGAFAGTLTGEGTLGKTTSATLTLSGANSGFLGPIAIIDGTVKVTSAAALGTGVVQLGNSIYDYDTKLEINATSSTTINNIIQAKTSVSNVIQNTSTNLVTLEGELSKNGAKLILAGRIVVNSNITGSSENSDLVLGDGSTNSADVTLYYGNTYNYNGPTTVNSGSTLTLQDGISLTNSHVTINAGATLVLEYATLGFTLKSLTMQPDSYLVVSGSLIAGTYTMITCSNLSSLSENVSYTGSLDATVSLAGLTNIQIVIVDNTPIPTSNVCFPAKTPVLTNCGYVNIEDINLAVHTIRNKKIVAITKTVAHDKNLVRIAKHALGHLYPEKTTFISQNHKVFCQGEMVKAKHLVDNCNVTLVPYNGQVLYNVLLAEHEKMQVNNLIVETLHPEHKVAKLYRFLKNVDAVHHGKLIAAFNKCDSEQRLHR